MLGHREPRSVTADTTQVLAKTTPKGPSGFTNVKNSRASVTGYAVHKITGLAGDMAKDRKRVARASYLGVLADVLASMATGALTRM